MAGEQRPGQHGHLGRCAGAAAPQPVGGHAGERAGDECGGHVVWDVQRGGGIRGIVGCLAGGDVDGRGHPAADMVDDACAALRPQQASIQTRVFGEIGEERAQ
ncbi:hypothetical protein OG874_24970 [Nocardia sp. NBC_00565]|nr:hypothetical protein [Nocardia sp. NBC_00565]WUC00154.1 hypothetical protein OG874_24970 [Nocardia sp. NBC_00565]